MGDLEFRAWLEGLSLYSVEELERMADDLMSLLSAKQRRQVTAIFAAAAARMENEWEQDHK